MELFKAIYSRRPVRAYEPKKIPDWMIERILDSARWAPSGENVQHWRFIVVRDQETKKIIADLCQEGYITNTAIYPYELVQNRLWYLPEEARPRVVEVTKEASFLRYPEEADVVIIPLACGEWYDAPLMLSPAMFGYVSIAMCVQNMWLTATSLGLGADFSVLPTSDLRRMQYLEELLGVPRTWHMVGIFTVGFPAHKSLIEPARYPLESIVFEEQWGRPYKRIAFRQKTSEGIVGSELPKMDVTEAIYTRRTIREYKLEKVDDWKIERILDTARYAPSLENVKAIRLVMIRDADTKKYFSDIAQESSKLLFGGAGVGYEMVQDRLWYIPPESRPKVLEAPSDGTLFRYLEQADTVLVGCYAPLWNDAPLFIPTEFYGAMSLSFAIQNMWLSARAFGLGGGLNFLPMADERRGQFVRELLGVPTTWRVFTTFAIGVPRTPRMLGPPRFSLESIAFEEHWGRRYKRLAFREGPSS